MRPCINSAFYEDRNTCKSTNNEARLVHIRMPIVCRNIRPSSSTKVLLIGYSSILLNQFVSGAAPDYEYIFGPHRGIRLHL